MRKCPQCKTLKFESEFSSDGHGDYQRLCKECTQKNLTKMQALKEGNFDYIRKNDPARWDRMVLSTLFTNASRRARKLGVEFTITRDDIPLVHTCPILGAEMTLHHGKQENNSYSLDRVDDSKGYVPGNVRVISWYANFVKRELTKEQVQRLLEYLNGNL